MNCYQITSFLHGVASTRFVGSQAEAAARRAALVKAGVHRANITTAMVEVPTDKKGLLAFINNSTAP